MGKNNILSQKEIDELLAAIESGIPKGDGGNSLKSSRAINRELSIEAQVQDKLFSLSKQYIEMGEHLEEMVKKFSSMHEEESSIRAMSESSLIIDKFTYNILDIAKKRKMIREFLLSCAKTPMQRGMVEANLGDYGVLGDDIPNVSHLILDVFSKCMEYVKKFSSVKDERLYYALRDGGEHMREMFYEKVKEAWGGKSMYSAVLSCIYTFERIPEFLDDEAFHHLILNVHSSVLLMAMWDMPKEFQEKFFSHMSQENASSLRETMKSMKPPYGKREIIEAQCQVMDTLFSMARMNDISLPFFDKKEEEDEMGEIIDGILKGDKRCT